MVRSGTVWLSHASTARLSNPPHATPTCPSSGRRDTGVTHRRAERGRLCSSSSSPSCPLVSLIQTGVWRTGWTPASGSAPLALCWSGWRDSVCEKAPYLSVSERGCSFLGTLSVLSPGTLIWLSKVRVTRGPPRGWARRSESAAAWCVAVTPARGQEKGFKSEAGSTPDPSTGAG